MPRRSSGGGGRSSGGFSRSSGGKSSSWFSPRPASSKSASTTPARPASSTPASDPPKPAAPAPPPGPVPAPMPSGGIGSSFTEGMAFGGGNAIAHRAVDSLAGPRVVRHETVASSAPAAASESVGGPEACGIQFKSLLDCLNHNETDISKCQFYMNMFSECRKGSNVGLNA